MRRLVLCVVAALAALAATAGAANAHPLGNFSVNHLSKVAVSSDRVEIRYVVDKAEIPTFQERDRSPEEVLAATREEVMRGIVLRVDGRPVVLDLAPGGRITMPEGQGGLVTTRVELSLSAAVSDPGSVELRDDTFPDRVGWKAIVAEPGEGTAVRSDAPSGDPTDELRSYPDQLLDSPANRRQAAFEVEPGSGSLVAPRAEGGENVSTSASSGDRFTALFDDAASGEGVLVLLLLAAFGWGALHALSPGHGKAMIAAYLIGARGTARHAVWLGATVTVTHTIGVFALGLVALLLSQYILPEQLYPWLTLVSGLLVVVVGAGVLRSRIRWARAGREQGTDGHEHDHGPSADAPLHHHDSGASHHHHHDHDHHHGRGHQHHHGHHHHHGDQDEENAVSRRGLIGMGAAAGLIPCPSALVVLLGAIAQHEVGLGLLLIVAFSAGLAATLTALGLLVVHARRLLPRRQLDGRLARALPAASAVAIVGVGCVLTAQAVPGVV